MNADKSSTPMKAMKWKRLRFEIIHDKVRASNDNSFISVNNISNNKLCYFAF